MEHFQCAKYRNGHQLTCTDSAFYRHTRSFPESPIVYMLGQKEERELWGLRTAYKKQDSTIYKSRYNVTKIYCTLPAHHQNAARKSYWEENTEHITARETDVTLREQQKKSKIKCILPAVQWTTAGEGDHCRLGVQMIFDTSLSITEPSGQDRDTLSPIS